MPVRTRLHKAERDNIVFLAVWPLPLRLGDEIAAVNQRPGALTLRPLHRILRREPFGEAVNNDATRRGVRVLTVSGRLPHREALPFQRCFNLAEEAGFDDLPLSVVASPIPRVP